MDILLREYSRKACWPLNQVDNFLSSSFIVQKRLIVFESEIYKFVSSAKIEISLLELLQRSFISKKNKIGIMLSLIHKITNIIFR